MKILFLSTLAFDANISIIKRLRDNNDVYFITEALYEKYNHIPPSIVSKVLTKASELDYLKKFGDFIDLDKSYVLKGIRMKNVIKKLWHSYKVDKLSKSINPDVVIVDAALLTYFFSLIRYRKRTLFFVHDPFLHSGENKLADRILRFFYFKFIPNKLLFNSAQKREFIELYNCKAENVFDSFLSIYEYLWTFVDNKSDEDKADSSIFKLLFFGRISPYKGVDYLVSAFKHMAESGQYPNMELTIAGGGQFYFNIDAYKAVKGITIINRFINPDELGNLIKESDVCICPYTDATQSGVIMSAYAFEKPIIATDVGGLREMLGNGEMGTLIEPKNENAIVKAISEVYKDRELLKVMSQNIKKHYFEGGKSWNVSVRRIESALQIIQALNNKRN